MDFTQQHKDAVEKRAGLSDALLKIPKEAAERVAKLPESERDGWKAGDAAPMSSEEQERFDKINVDILALDATIKRLDISKAEQDRANERQALLAANSDDKSDTGDKRRVDFNTSLKRWGLGLETSEDVAGLGMKKEGRNTVVELVQPTMDRRLMSGGEINEERIVKALRAQSVGTDSEGGYTVPEGFWNSLIESRLAFGGMRQARTFVFRTATGNDLPIPTVDDTSNTGAILNENTEDSELDVVFSEVILQAFKYTSKIVKVPFELMQDSAFDMAAFLGRILGTRLGRIENTHFTTGDASSKPNGAVTASALGKTAASSTAITHAEMTDLEHSVDPAYRNGAEFMFNDSTLSAIKQLTVGSSDDRPLWAPGMVAGAPNTINGLPYVINQDMGSIATGVKVALFGDFSQYWIRDVGSLRLKRLDERYSEFDQVAFVALMRTDADLIDAGTDPLKHYIMA